MKDLSILIAISFAFSACKTPVKLTNATTTSGQDNTQMDVELRIETGEQSTTHTMVDIGVNSTTVEETTVKEYDTSLPVDTITGKHPVKTETTTRKTTMTGKQAKEQSLSMSSNAATSELIDKTTKDVAITTSATHEENPKTPKIAYYLYIILIVGIFVAGYVLNRKFKWLKLLG